MYTCIWKVYNASGSNRGILKRWGSSTWIFLYRDSPGSTWAHGSRLHGCTRLAAAKPLRGYCDFPMWQDHFGSLVELASLAQSKRQGVKRWKRADRCLTSKRVLLQVTLDDLWRMPLMRTVKEYHDVVCVLCHYHSVLSTFILNASILWQNMVEPSKVCHFITLLCTLHCFWMEVDHLECSTVEHAWFSMWLLLLQDDVVQIECGDRWEYLGRAKVYQSFDGKFWHLLSKARNIAKWVKSKLFAGRKWSNPHFWSRCVLPLSDRATIWFESSDSEEEKRPHIEVVGVWKRPHF